MKFLKAVHFSLASMLAAIAGIVTAVITKNPEALVAAILALVTAFLPAVQLILPWFSSAPVKGEMPKFQECPKP